jgi:hypothetical protein
MELARFKKVIGFGIAGNFANHLEQAGEVSDFVDVKVEEANAPKGLFPFYQPNNSDTFLHTFPLTNDTITMPKKEQGENLQVEPEVGLLCDIVYDENHHVTGINPKQFGAYNDCTIRKEGAKKISERKNWAPLTKGVSTTFFAIDRFERGGVMDRFHIASFLKRNGELYEYGEDSPLLGYSYFYGKLIQWMISKFNTQQDHGPLEDLASILKLNNYPKEALISIGATRYTHVGETTYLKPGDEIYIAVYDATRYKNTDIRNFAEANDLEKADISFLYQKVE